MSSSLLHYLLISHASALVKNGQWTAMATDGPLYVHAALHSDFASCICHDPERGVMMNMISILYRSGVGTLSTLGRRIEFPWITVISPGGFSRYVSSCVAIRHLSPLQIMYGYCNSLSRVRWLTGRPMRTAGRRLRQEAESCCKLQSDS